MNAGHGSLVTVLVIIFIIANAWILWSWRNFFFRLKSGGGDHPSNLRREAFDGLEDFRPFSVGISLRDTGPKAPRLGGRIVHLHQAKGHTHSTLSTELHPGLTLRNRFVNGGRQLSNVGILFLLIWEKLVYKPSPRTLHILDENPEILDAINPRSRVIFSYKR